MRRESQDFTPGVHAAGEAESYIKRPASPRHFLPPELTLTWDPIRQVVVEARVLPRLGLGSKPCRLPVVSGVGLEAHGRWRFREATKLSFCFHSSRLS